MIIWGTTVLAVLAIFAIWADRELLNPDNWANTSTRLLQNVAIRDATANYAVDQLYANVDVAGQIKSGLPKQIQPLAGPAAGALRSVAVDATKIALSDPRVQNLWSRANRSADQTFVTVVNGGKGPVRVQNGEVTLDLASIIDDLAGRLGLPSSITSKIPPSVGKLTILRSNQIRLVQNAGRALRGLALLLTIIVPLLYALAIGLARGRRRRTLMSVGFAIVIAGVVVLFIRSILEAQVANALVKDESIKPAANAVVAIATSTLSDIAGAFIVVGIPLVAAAWFAGPARSATEARHTIAPLLRDRPDLTFGIVAAAMALVFVWQPIAATGTPAGIIVFLGLAMLGTELLRRQTAREFPDAKVGAVRAELKAQLRKLGEHRPRRIATPHQPPPAAGAAPTIRVAAPTIPEQLERLAALRDRGDITPAEYDTAKADVLAGR